MADLEKKDAVVSNVQLEADSLEFDVNTNLSLTAPKASPGGATTPSLQELIEAELSARLCQPDSLEPPSSPALHSLLSYDSIEPVPPASNPTPNSAPSFSLDSLADLDPLKDPLGQVDAESGIGLLSPSKLENLSNPDSLESSDLLESPARCCSPPPPQDTDQCPLLSDTDVTDSRTEQESTAAGVHSSLLTMEDNLTTAPGPQKQSLESLQSDVEVTQQTHLSDDSSLDLQAGRIMLRVSSSDLLSIESISVSKSGEASELSDLSGDVCSTPDDLSTSNSSSSNVQGRGAPHTSSSSSSREDMCESEELDEAAAGGLASTTITTTTTNTTTTLLPALTLLTSSTSPSISDPTSSSPPPSTPRDPNSSSPLPPSSPQAGALTPSSTNSVCGDSWHGGDEGSGGWSGDDGGGGVGDSGGGGERTPGCDEDCGDDGSDQDPPLPPPTTTTTTHTNMDDDEDFWSSMKNTNDDDDDNYVSSTGYTKREEPTSKKEEEGEEEEEEEEGEEIRMRGYREEDEMVVDVDEGTLEGVEEDVDEVDDTKGVLLRRKKPRAENGVAKTSSSSAGSGEATADARKAAAAAAAASKSESIVTRKTEEQEVKGGDSGTKTTIRTTTTTTTITKTEETAAGDKKKSKSKTENGVAMMEVEKEGGGGEEEEVTRKKKHRKKVMESQEENGVQEEGGEEEGEVVEKKKKKKSRSTEDGEKKKKKKKKKGDSEKENKDSSTSSGSEAEEELPAPPTPPLFNGRALTNGITPPHRAQDEELLIHREPQTETEEKWTRREEQIVEEIDVHEAYDDSKGFTRENFDSLIDTYNNKQEEVRPSSPLSDQENLAGVNVKQLTVSYLSVAQKDKGQANHHHKSDIPSEIKADLNTSVNISSLVDTYTSPPPRATTPSRPDDLTPVSFRSLKSAYEATASGGGGAVSRYSSSGSSSPAGGSPAPKEELNISLHQLREEYCRSVQDGYSRSQTPSRPPLDTGISIRQLQVSQVSSDCRQCGKQVFQMEKIVAEKASWHKNCFRCKECNCLLTLETYQSHEGVLYCKPHFKELFRPKAVVEDEAEARKERSTNKPDYGLEELSTASLKQKFAMFEQITTEEEKTPEPIPVRRSQSLLGRAQRFLQSEDDDYGIENSELGEYEEYDEDEEDEDEEDEEEEEVEGEDGEIIKKKGRPTSFSGLKDLKAGFARKNRQEELSKRRREELSRFRQMLCAGKNITTREMFEGGNEDEDGRPKRKEQIKIDGCPAAKNLRERFEKGMSISEEHEDHEERKEIDHVFRQAETASKARNMFKQIDTAVVEGEEPVMRPRSSAQARRENRLSRDGIDIEERELGRDPNLIKCTDNYEDAVDCRGTRDLLAKFRKMEMQNEEDDLSPRPLKRFTPPPDGEEEYDSEDEYSDEEYSDEEEDSEEDDEEEDDEDEEEDRKPKYKDEILEMVNSSQSARKAASLRAKFEKWESEVERNNEYNHSDKVLEEEEEGMPSIDTARNLRAMFENKAQEAARPVDNRPKLKVNRFVGGGGDKCMSCDRTVYAMERLEVAAKVLHKNCFKCCKCNTRLSMNTFSIGGNDMYCTTHYKQAFTEKGTYDVFTPNKELHKQYKISVH